MNKLKDFPRLREDVSKRLGELIDEMERLLESDGAVVYIITYRGSNFMQYIVFATRIDILELESFFSRARQEYGHLTFEEALEELEREGFIRIIVNLKYVVDESSRISA